MHGISIWFRISSTSSITVVIFVALDGFIIVGNVAAIMMMFDVDVVIVGSIAVFVAVVAERNVLLMNVALLMLMMRHADFLQ